MNLGFRTRHWCQWPPAASVFYLAFIYGYYAEPVFPKRLNESHVSGSTGAIKRGNRATFRGGEAPPRNRSKGTHLGESPLRGNGNEKQYKLCPSFLPRFELVRLSVEAEESGAIAVNVFAVVVVDFAVGAKAQQV